MSLLTFMYLITPLTFCSSISPQVTHRKEAKPMFTNRVLLRHVGHCPVTISVKMLKFIAMVYMLFYHFHFLTQLKIRFYYDLLNMNSAPILSSDSLPTRIRE